MLRREFVKWMAMLGTSFLLNEYRADSKMIEPLDEEYAMIPDKHKQHENHSARFVASPVRLPYRKVLPGDITNYDLMTFSGGWGHEYEIQVLSLTSEGYRFLETAGESCAHHIPYWLLRNRITGNGVAVALAYMGNWCFEVKSEGGNTSVEGRTSPASLPPFAHIQGLSIPGALASEFTGDWDYGALPIVRFIRSHLLRKHDEDWPWVEYNNWYAYDGNFDEASVINSAHIAKDLGCEAYVMDAGWYGGDNWSNTVGDWRVNRSRLPNGLEPISEMVHGLGMKFGLWVEIECAYLDSPIVREHPDWLLKEDGKPLSNRSVLDFGNPDVLAYAKSVIDRLVKDYHLDYLKMDFNTPMPLNTDALTSQTDPLYQHYKGLAELWTYMREKHPKLIVENCSSGSLREDLTPAAYTDTHWVSDNVDNHMNLMQNFGATYLFPPEMCLHWTVFPNPSDAKMDVEAQFMANLMVHFGLSGRIDQWDDAILKQAKKSIATYKRIRAVLRNADVHHLTPQVDGSDPRSMQAMQYMDSRTDEGLLFAFQAGDGALEHTFKLHGLQPKRKYHLNPLSAFGESCEKTGDELMRQGYSVKFPHSGASVLIGISSK
jgi:alpha-galactosidase